jgi:hypothetical protein
MEVSSKLRCQRLKGPSIVLLKIALASVFQPGQVFLPVMTSRYRIELDEQEWGQLLDGSECRAQSWRRTADYPRTGEMPDGELFLIEECSHEEEADGLAAHYETIIKSIQAQMELQL